MVRSDDGGSPTPTPRPGPTPRPPAKAAKKTAKKAAPKSSGAALDTMTDVLSGQTQVVGNANPGAAPKIPTQKKVTTYTDPVKQFQAAHGLVPDGIVGPKTIAAGWAGSGHSPVVPHAPAYGNFAPAPVTMGAGTAKALLDAGMKTIGVPYVWGGTDLTSGVDCSGLVQSLYKQQGINVPRTADDQSKSGIGVSARDAQPGDLIAFDNDPARPGADHIGIYLGGGKMLQSPHTGANVQVVAVDLGSASAIRRVLPANAYAGLGRTTQGLVYKVPGGIDVTGSTPPTSITAANGGGGLTGGSLGLPKDPTVAQINDAVAKNFGYLSAFLHDPEVGPILREGAIKGWDQATLFGHLYNTRWWQNTSATTRQWDSDQKLDPASNREKLKHVTDTLTVQAQRAGLSLSSLQMHDLGVNSLRFGWDAQQTTNALLAVGKMQLGPTAPASDALSSKQQLKQIAAQYHLNLSDPAYDKWVGDIISGRMSTNDFTAYAQEQAKSQWPTLTAALDRGSTVEQYIQPYRQMIATTHEVSPDSIDFVNDPKYSRILNQIDPKTGERTVMSLADAQQYLRGMPEFQKTEGAKDQAARLTNKLLEDFGAVKF